MKREINIRKEERETAARFYKKAQEIRQRGHRVREAIEDQEQLSEEWFLVGKKKT
jgi:predicted ribosome quality control (RQC) complex YloA/Tae2 family protein